MDIVVVGGFLGAGKTTMLLSLAKRLVDEGTGRIAIIENEIGKVGIDDGTLREAGLQVKELFSGCICCSLRLDLVTTLLEVERELTPDLVVIEPSGAASPRQVVDALQGYGGEIEKIVTVVLLDARRFRRIEDLGIPLIRSGVEAADLLLLNKIDRVEPGDVATVEERVRRMREDAPFLPVSAETGEGMEEAFSRLRECLRQESDKSAPRHETEAPAAVPASSEGAAPSLPGGVAVSRQWRLSLTPACSGDEAGDRVAAALGVLVEGLREDGCELVGHVKAVVKGKSAGYETFSITEFNQPAARKGRLAARLDEAVLVANAIVVGLPAQTVRKRVDAFGDALGGIREETP